MNLNSNNYSILLTIKELLGITQDDNAFDIEITTHINSVFLDLQQIGIGPKEGFQITGNRETWMDFNKDGLLDGSITSFIYLKVKLLFDPPTSASAIESINRLLDKTEWRLNLAAELKKDGKEQNQNA